eukprot:CAMPEP_0206441788 /NCGR_PEP_ID=MMETSP0324_2-20121206/13468_1 /ASSEMBLY_ACC=CAM_ASM_000836 /TAXON_ID=2866 /ORGANISM="Crypthecodinium cohnii, Strain Seligo" /LENGTH=416 /DNA_ID=CAMNT_0053909573 /DNA_START=124 /DNA_END=1371 /DNA_ORIENTATION=-
MGSSSSSWCSGRDRAEEAKEQVGIGMAEATPELEDEALATAPKSPPPTLLPTARAMREALNAAKRKKEESAKKTTAVCCVAPSSNEKEEDEAAKRWKAVKAAWEQQLNEVMIRAQQDGNSDGQASQTQTQQRWRQQQQQQQQQLLLQQQQLQQRQELEAQRRRQQEEAEEQRRQQLLRQQQEEEEKKKLEMQRLQLLQQQKEEEEARQRQLQLQQEREEQEKLRQQQLLQQQQMQQQQMQQQQQQQMQQQQMQQQQEVKADGSMRARDLPEGWVAVYSEAHQREYYWNRQTKETTWIPPTPTPPTVPPTAAAGEAGMEILSFPDWRTARRSISSLKRRYRTGDVLERADFALVRSLLEHHPDRDSKVGQGVTAIKLDRSLHEDASDCFWVIRVDGTAEDFSANKCFRQLQFLEREA